MPAPRAAVLVVLVSCFVCAVAGPVQPDAIEGPGEGHEGRVTLNDGLGLCKENVTAQLFLGSEDTESLRVRAVAFTHCVSELNCACACVVIMPVRPLTRPIPQTQNALVSASYIAPASIRIHFTPHVLLEPGSDIDEARVEGMLQVVGSCVRMHSWVWFASVLT